jgi:hypothetical protein
LPSFGQVNETVTFVNRKYFKRQRWRADESLLTEAITPTVQHAIVKRKKVSIYFTLNRKV